MSATSKYIVLLSLNFLLVMVAVVSASPKDIHSDHATDKSEHASFQTKRRNVPCVENGGQCYYTNPTCCNTRDICMIYNYRDGLLKNGRCVTWDDSLAVVPLLPVGSNCTSSWQCTGHCCREHMFARRSPVYECGTPYNDETGYDCVAT